MKPHVKLMTSIQVKPRSNATNLVTKPARVFGIFSCRDSLKPFAFAPTVRRLGEMLSHKKGNS